MQLIYENEEIRIGNGFPSLVRFFQGNSTKPLVVFFPGWAHLGRISYGFPGCKKEHFLAHWLTEKGYPFLATSYPLDHAVYDRVYPEFTLTDWGKMAAEIVNQVIVEKSFENKTFFAFTEYPMIANSSGDSRLAPYHRIFRKGKEVFIFKTLCL